MIVRIKPALTGLFAACLLFNTVAKVYEWYTGTTKEPTSQEPASPKSKSNYCNITIPGEYDLPPAFTSQSNWNECPYDNIPADNTVCQPTPEQVIQTLENPCVIPSGDKPPATNVTIYVRE